MRYGVLYILGLCLLLSFKAAAEALPANPWLQEDGRVWLKTAEDTASANLDNEQIDLIKNINSQIEKSRGYLPQIANEALPQKQENPAKIKLPSWNELFPQADTQSITLKMQAASRKRAARQTSQSTSESSSSNQEMFKTVSGIGKQYNQIKRTTNGYINKVKKGWNQLEKEAQNSIGQLQKMMK